MTRTKLALALTCIASVALTATPVGATLQDMPPLAVEALVETPPRFDDEEGGDADADDPAIWVRADSPSDSVVLGTLKNGGLEAFGLQGQLLQHIDTPPPPAEGLEAGRFNNVDVLGEVDVAGLPAQLAVVTDRGRDRLRIYAIDAAGVEAGDGVLTDVTVDDAPRLFSATEEEVEEQATGYGLALRTDADGRVWAAVSQRHRTTIGLFRLFATADGTVTYEPRGQVELPTSFPLPDGDTWSPCEEPGEDPQVEGMVVDKRSDVLYAAQEDVGVWRIPLDGADLGIPRLVERVREFGVPATYDPDTEECTASAPDPGFGGEHLSADAEGLTIAYQDNGRATLVASSQGDNTFSLYRLRPEVLRLPWIRSFEVVDSAATDGVQHSDGAAVVTTAVGPTYPRGLLVVHDGDNTPVVEDEEGEERANTNFKYLRWDDVRK